MTLPPAVMDTTDATFQQDVIERSHELPVVVDFWAPWCGPCRILGPTLERLAYENAGAVQLAKLNTDENPQAASAFGIQGIPAVKAFHKGKLVDEFTGALPEPQVRAFFDRLKPSEADLKTAEAKHMLAEGRWETAQLHLESALEEDPNHKEATLGLAELLWKHGDKERAAELANRWPGEPDAKRILGALELETLAGGQDRAALEARIAADEHDAEAHYLLGGLRALEEQWEPALEHLLQSVRLDRSVDDDGARRRMIDIFNLLGDGNPLVPDYRRRLGSVIF